jgi:hypothetical protein
MIEPPGDLRGRRVFKIDDRVLVAGEIVFIEESPGPVHKTDEFEFGVGTNPLAVEAREKGGGTRPVKALVVVKNSNEHSGPSSDEKHTAHFRRSSKINAEMKNN